MLVPTIRRMIQFRALFFFLNIGSHCVAQADCQISNLKSASASQVVGFQVWATRPSKYYRTTPAPTEVQ